MNVNQIIHGDNIEVLKSYPDNSIDSIVTDAPYGLGKEPSPVKVMKAWAECGHYDVQGKGFMGKTWDAFVPQPAFWKECYRVLKPGGHVLCFFGTRTYDWGVMAMRFAGFEVRDCLQWIYGSGFPKSLDIAKQIDKEAGYWRGKAGAVTIESQPSKGKEYERTDKGEPVTAAAAAWNGWGSNLKPAVEPIVLARKPIIEKTIAANVLKWGTGGLNIDGCRIEDEKIITQKKEKGSSFTSVGESQGYNGCAESTNTGRFPSNVILDDEAAELLDKQSGVLMSGDKSGVYNSWGENGILGTGKPYQQDVKGDSGYASRFFYIAKASPGEREQGVRWMSKSQGGSCQRANTHPTVKPISLMQHLVRLITPKNGICLDPFSGSGTTCIACKLENMQYIGIEMDAEYVTIAQERIKAYATQLKIF